MNNYCRSAQAEIIEFLVKLEKYAPYCLARGEATSFFKAGSDIDILIKKKDIDVVHSNILRNESWVILNLIRRQYVYTYFILSKNSQITFQIDFEFDFDWWSFLMLDAADILNRRQLSHIYGIYVACEDDANFMKFFRSVMWGGVIKENYIDHKFTLRSDSHLGHKFLKSLKPEFDIFFSNLQEGSTLKKQTKKLRWKLIFINIKQFGFLSTVVKFLKFLISEVRVLNSKNGFALWLSGDSQCVESVKSDLINKVLSSRSPFKGINIITRPLGLVERLKMQRDSVLMIYDFDSPHVDIKIKCYSEDCLTITKTQQQFEQAIIAKNLWSYIIYEIK